MGLRRPRQDADEDDAVRLDGDDLSDRRVGFLIAHHDVLPLFQLDAGAALRTLALMPGGSLPPGVEVRPFHRPHTSPWARRALTGGPDEGHPPTPAIIGLRERSTTAPATKTRALMPLQHGPGNW